MVRKTTTQTEPAIRLPSRLPQHVAIIMDGNGRWARERGLPRIEGHRAGAEAARDVAQAAAEWGIKYLTLYAFSEENWKRPRAEVDALMELLESFLEAKLDELKRSNVRLRAIGRISSLPPRVQKRLQEAIDATAKNTGLTLTLALSYSGRTEIVDAVRKIVQDVKDGRLAVEDIDEAAVSRRLYTAGLPDPDLLIRTSGEMRVSNFLLWQISYSELWITPTLWPDFRRTHLLQALQDYSKRHRRYGGV